MIEWQPISTAPRDGRRLLLMMDENAIVVVGLCCIDMWICSWDGVDLERAAKRAVTHWMPLPAPPVPA